MGVGRAKPLSRMGVSFPPTAMPYTVPASVGGMNTLDSLMSMPPQDCIYAYNLMPAERGMKLRKGYREWANNLGSEEIRTILPYQSQNGDGTKNRLFAVTKDGIFNITIRQAHPTGIPNQTAEIAFGTQTDPAGYGVKCEFTNDASDHFMFYADAVNGIHQYTESTNAWTAVVGGTGAGQWQYDNAGTPTAFLVADVAFVMVFKQRIWVVLEDSDDAWYLPVASIAGVLTKFTFGAKLPHGGDLMGLWNWTVDGGAGVDDMLIAVSRGGDVAVYQGGDPSLSDFGAIGEWFIGTIPNSRRIVAAYGAEMYILSTYGVTSLMDLLQGTPSSNVRSSISAKINEDLRIDILADVASSEWSINIHPADGFLQIVAPKQTNRNYVQYNQNLNTKAWGLWELVPTISADTWDGGYYMGTTGGQALQYTGVSDGGLIDGTAGVDVEYRILTSFQAPGDHSSFKRVGFIRTIAISSPIASFSAVAVYDYDESAALAQSTVQSVDNGALWDTSGVWDTSLWGSTVNKAYDFSKGSLGMGRTFAIGMRGHSNARIEVVGWDVTMTTGGFL